MIHSHRHSGGGSDIVSPLRNHYFHGKMMDAYHFEMETAYHSHLRALVNRTVLGTGVVCGLNVTHPHDCAADRPAVNLAYGVAIDAWGRVVVVPDRLEGVEIPKGVIHEALGLDDESAAGTASRHVGAHAPYGQGHDHHGDDDDEDESG